MRHRRRRGSGPSDVSGAPHSCRAFREPARPLSYLFSLQTPLPQVRAGMIVEFKPDRGLRCTTGRNYRHTYSLAGACITNFTRLTRAPGAVLWPALPMAEGALLTECRGTGLPSGGLGGS